MVSFKQMGKSYKLTRTQLWQLWQNSSIESKIKIQNTKYKIKIQKSKYKIQKSKIQNTTWPGADEGLGYSVGGCCCLLQVLPSANSTVNMVKIIILVMIMLTKPMLLKPMLLKLMLLPMVNNYIGDNNVDDSDNICDLKLGESNAMSAPKAASASQ